MNIFDRSDASRPASENQFRHAHGLATRQGLDMEVLCTLEFKKEFADLITRESSQLIERFN